jgi:hypothetical protein
MASQQEHDLAIHINQFKAVRGCACRSALVLRSNSRLRLRLQALSERSEGNGLNLDDLGKDSPLGSMLVLEALRFKGGPLHPVRRCCCVRQPLRAWA